MEKPETFPEAAGWSQWKAAGNFPADLPHPAASERPT